jgi:hypothetical protein
LVVVETLDVRHGKERGCLASIECKIFRAQFEEVAVGAQLPSGSGGSVRVDSAI